MCVCVGYLRDLGAGIVPGLTALVGALVTNPQHRLPGAHNTYDSGKEVGRNFYFNFYIFK